MKVPLLEVSNHVIFYLGLFLLLKISCEAIPVSDGIPGNEARVRHDIGLKKFYGPWSNVQKLNGEYAEYSDYGGHVVDFEPSPEDVSSVESDESEETEAVVPDFHSNYGEFESDDSHVEFQPSIADDQPAVNEGEEGDDSGGEPENPDELDGNVQWTSAAT